MLLISSNARSGDQERLFQDQVVIGGWVMVLKGAGFCVALDKTKGEVDLKHSRLIGKDVVQWLAESRRTDRGQGKLYKSCSRFWQLNLVRMCDNVAYRFLLCFLQYRE